MDADSNSVIIDVILGLFFGLILSWSIGVAPALIYRYSIFKKPIEKKNVFWLLAPAVVVLMFAFKLTMAEVNGTQPIPNPIPWIIVYYIGKWIMTRKPKTKEESSQFPIAEQPVSPTPPPVASSGGSDDFAK